MRKKPNLPPAAAEMRRLAEERLKEQHSAANPARNEADIQRLVHELQVHQVELEMQNEELQKARLETETHLEKYSDLYDFAPIGYLTLDREGTIREANLTGAGLLGVERAQLVNRRFARYVPAADLPAFAAFLRKVFESNVRQSCDVTLLKEGRLPVPVRIEATVAASGRECRVVLDDITEQKRAEENRLVLNKLESTGILAGGIAHDFNNLLTMILLKLELAKSLVPPNKELAHVLEQAKQATLTSAALTQQLLTFARGGAPVRKPTRLSGLIEESISLAMSGSRARCDLLLAEDLRLVEVDAGQIGQVIRNLILNAREAMPHRGVISVRAENVVLRPHEIPSQSPGDYIRVSIADQGGGIPKEILPKIFDPYFSTKQRGSQKGMGLGLTICHMIIQKHGGAMAAESEAGVGTTFHFYLPGSRELLPEKKLSAPTGHPRHRRILVMDDEEEVRKLVRRLLQQMGHEVELAEDGERALEVYENAIGQGCRFDLVILDLTIRGGVGGRETIQALLKVDPAVKAIVMSGYATDPVILEPERYGFKTVLAKPFEATRLREALSQVLDPVSSGK